MNDNKGLRIRFERNVGLAVRRKKQVLRFAQDDN